MELGTNEDVGIYLKSVEHFTRQDFQEIWCISCMKELNSFCIFQSINHVTPGPLLWGSFSVEAALHAGAVSWAPFG